MKEYIEVAKSVLRNNLNLQQEETMLIVGDDELLNIADIFFQAGRENGNEVVLMHMLNRVKSGEEPPRNVAEAMKSSEVVLCITKHSLTHTHARKEASKHGARVATMPGITLNMLKEGAIAADYNEVKEKTAKYCKILDKGSSCKIIKDDSCLSFSIKDRKGIPSTGLFHQTGESGNLPSGEGYIAPLENSANGTVIIDGSIAGLGVLDAPVTLTLEDGRLIHASGETGDRLLEMLGDGDGRIIAEFGIGTNTKARLTGNVLEDEKVYGTVHIAFGSNKPFGGTTDAGVHIDCVIKEPTVFIDDKKIDLS